MHLRTSFTRLPSSQNLKQAIAFRKIRDFGGNRIPSDVTRSSHCRETHADLIPIRAVSLGFGRSDPRKSRCIQQNHAFVGYFEIDRTLGRNRLREGHDRFGKRARVVDIGSVGLRDELQSLVPGRDRAPIERR